MLKFYDWKLSPNAFKVRVMLHEVAQEHETIELDILKGEGQKPEFLQVNPNGKVPAIEDGALTLWESNAILLYLARKTGRFLPTDPAGQALVDQWLFWQAAHYYMPVIGLALEKMIKPILNQDGDPEEIQKHTRDFQRLSQILEQHLSQYDWLAGEFSVADLSVASTLFPRQKLGLSIAEYPNLSNWLSQIEARSGWQKALALSVPGPDSST